LVSDIEQLYAAIKSLNEKLPDVTSNRAGTSRTEAKSSVIEVPGGTANWTYSVVNTIDVSIRGSVSARLTPPRFSFNVVNTAWEFLPWSFVIDWFISIGTWLNSLNTLIFSASTASSGGLLVTYNRVIDGEMLYHAADYSGGANVHSSCTAVLRKRVPMGIPKSPLLRVKLDGDKLRDLGFLLRQLLR
jgi:hypothetical protein